METQPDLEQLVDELFERSDAEIHRIMGQIALEVRESSLRYDTLTPL